MLYQDPDKSSPGITLPRISFEIMDIDYDPTRKLSRGSMCPTSQGNALLTPYNIQIQMSIMVKYIEDGNKIVEQILPFFTPDFTPAVELVEGATPFDIPIVLTSTTVEDSYENDFQTRRAIIWTLNFTMKSLFLGPQDSGTQKLIKIAKSNIYDGLTANNYVEQITVRPGLTANGEPTTSANNSIPAANIEFTDDWGYIVTIEDYEE